MKNKVNVPKSFLTHDKIVAVKAKIGINIVGAEHLKFYLFLLKLWNRSSQVAGRFVCFCKLYVCKDNLDYL